MLPAIFHQTKRYITTIGNSIVGLAIFTPLLPQINADSPFLSTSALWKGYTVNRQHASTGGDESWLALLRETSWTF
jgi:hypothetical protein